MIKKCYNHTLQTNPWHREEKPQKTNSHKTRGRQLYQSSLFLIKMIAKLERTLGLTKTKHRTPTNNRSRDKNESTTVEPPP